MTSKGHTCISPQKGMTVPPCEACADLVNAAKEATTPDFTIEGEWVEILKLQGMLVDRIDRLVLRAGCKDRLELMTRLAHTLGYIGMWSHARLSCAPPERSRTMPEETNESAVPADHKPYSRVGR